jgi:hypothetical protein
MGSLTSEPAATPSTPAPSAPVPAGKPKRSPLPYILLGCFGLLVLAGLGFVATTWFVANKIKQAGIDPELMRTNPALAAAKMMAAVNPDIEVLDVDEGRGTITVREKSTGKRMTVNLEDAKQGRIVFREEGKGEVEIKTEGGQVQVRTPEGTQTYGATANAPDFLPAYSGAQGQGMFTSSTQGGNQGTYTFKTTDSVEQVVAFYERELPGKGFEVKRTGSHTAGGTRLETFTATGGGKTVTFNVMRSAEETVVTATWQ